jgi:hypothetical protein
MCGAGEGVAKPLKFKLLVVQHMQGDEAVDGDVFNA